MSIEIEYLLSNSSRIHIYVYSIPTSCYLVFIVSVVDTLIDVYNKFRKPYSTTNNCNDIVMEVDGDINEWYYIQILNCQHNKIYFIYTRLSRRLVGFGHFSTEKHVLY